MHESGQVSPGAAAGARPDPARVARARTALAGLALAAIVLAAWGHTLGFGFVWDDEPYIVNAEALRDPRNLGRMFTDRTVQADARTPASAVAFRPLRNVHYLLLVAAGGGEPRPRLFHAANVAWHAAAVVLLFLAARRLWRLDDARGAAPGVPPGLAAFVLAVAFALHPVASEAVCWAKALDDPMSAAFVFAATALAAAPRPTRRSAAGVAACFAAAVYAKESAVPFVAAAFLLEWRLRGVSARRAALRAVPLAAVAAAYLVHRHAVLGATRQVAPISGSYGQTLFDTVASAVRYAPMALGIPPFHADYAFLPAGRAWSDPSFWGGLALAAALAGLAAAGLARRGPRAAGWGAAWGAAFLLPVSNLVPMMQFLAVRFLYLPLAGLLLAALAPARRRLRPALFAAAGAAVALAWGAAARHRSWDWRDSLELFAADQTAGAGSWRTERNLLHRGLDLPHVRRFLAGEVPAAQTAAAWPAVERSLAQLAAWYPTNAILLNARGVAEFVRGEPAAALPLFLRAERADPSLPESHRNQALALARLGRREEAIAALRRLLRAHPGDVLGRGLLEQLERDAAPGTDPRACGEGNFD